MELRVWAGLVLASRVSVRGLEEVWLGLARNGCSEKGRRSCEVARPHSSRTMPAADAFGSKLQNIILRKDPSRSVTVSYMGYEGKHEGQTSGPVAHPSEEPRPPLFWGNEVFHHAAQALQRDVIGHAASHSSNNSHHDNDSDNTVNYTNDAKRSCDSSDHCRNGSLRPEATAALS